MPLPRVLLALGSNQGDAEGHLLAAVAELERHLEDLRVASLFRSEPLSPLPQASFLNTAASARTALEPEDLMAVLKRLELAAGRVAGRRYGPRPLDIDLLLAGGHECRRPELVLPHPGMVRRRFVLAPLAELEPELRLPPLGLSVSALLEEPGIQDQVVERLAWRAPVPRP